jgi:hypothetical protein
MAKKMKVNTKVQKKYYVDLKAKSKFQHRQIDNGGLVHIQAEDFCIAEP